MHHHNKKLFLSIVSNEFASYRELLAGDLHRPNLDVATQEDFITTGGSTLAKLDGYIRSCDGVVHIIGKATGSVPPESAVKDFLAKYPDFATRLPPLAALLAQPQPGFSYTQWEAYLAIYHARPLFIYRPTDFELAALHVPRGASFVFDADEEQSQREHYHRICALGHDRGQFLNEERLSTAVLRDLVEILPRLEACIQVPPTKLTHTAQELIGREEELTMLDRAWNEGKNVVVVRGKGGEGKTSLVASWMAELALKHWRGAEWVFDWSFYSQGTRDQGAASGENFIVTALGFFGDADPNAGGPEDRGARLARLVGARRGLLVLDGLEPLQYPPGPMHGQLTDKGVAALLRGLAAQNAGLCVVTTREKVDEIKQHYGKSAIDHSLEFLPPLAGAALLHYAGAQRAGEKAIAADDRELQQASVEMHGHALTLFLVGQYLKLIENGRPGDIRRRDCMKLAEADAEYKIDATRPYGHAFKAIEAYEKWFAAGDAQAQRQLAILRLLGLFDRPASAGCLTALRAAPAIAGLNEVVEKKWFGLRRIRIPISDKDWLIALGRLAEINLVGVQEDQSVDCHPLLREYFAVQLKTKTPAAWQAGHRRLYEYLCATTKEGDQPTLDDLQPLYQAVAHGCQAGLQQEVCDKVSFARIRRGNEDYTVRKLGAFGSDLGAIACFFEQPWSRVSFALTEGDQAWTLGQSAFYLRALGRLTEALEPMRASVVLMDKLKNWEQAATAAGNLSELELTLGEIGGAVGDAEQSVTYADRSDDAFWKLGTRTTHADALHQAGRRAEAKTRCREAEQMQSKCQPDYPLLYSVSGFKYCDLLLAAPERAAWRTVIQGVGMPERPQFETGTQGEESLSDGLKHENTLASCRAVSQRAAQTLKWEEEMRGAPLLDFALHHLTLGRAALYEGILSHSDLRVSSSELDSAVAGLRRAGTSHWIPASLLTRAWLRFLTSAADSTRPPQADPTGSTDSTGSPQTGSPQAGSPRAGLPQAAAESAREDLDEAWEIAERGPMKLFLADIHLHRARLFFRETPYPWNQHPDGTPRGPRDDLKDARRLIEECGYWRRKEELEDAEAVILPLVP